MKKKDRQELVEDAWRFENAEKIVADENIDMLAILNEQKECECVCDGLWIWCAKDILRRNNIPYEDFASALFDCLTKGREKFNNIIIVGPAGCGKTFLLKPLFTMIPNVFASPAGCTFGWMGAENANLLLLNDLRWKPRGPLTGGNIDWGDFLNLLEGMQVTLPAAMNVQDTHVVIKKKIPILATSINDVTYWVKDVSEPQTKRHEDENDMMSERWKSFTVRDRINKEERKNPPACFTCFSKFVLQV